LVIKLSNNVVNAYRYAGGAEVCQDISDQDTVMQQWNGSSGNKTGGGAIITNTGKGAEFIGLSVDTVKVWLRKGVGSPANSFSVGIYRDASKGTEQYNFHSGNLSAVTTSMVEYEYTSTSGSKHTIVSGDIVAITYPHNSGTLFSRIEYGSVYGGLVFALLGEWDRPPHDYWSYDGNSSGLTFCVG